ncbi:MAG: efflux RND transporter periplasmic adaptor subunit [Firmicutes bacterium]|jgi:RND family efflux transporter MFP subunit|nr:efflux RND transporter periplasmic adaptor subunit [Bacillota bacterium]
MLQQKRQLLVVFLAMLLVTLGAGCSLLPEERVDAPPPLLSPPEVRTVTYPVERGYIANELRTLGRVAAVRESTLYFRRSGRMRELLVEPGDAISENQILARLETGDLEHRLRLAKIDLERVEMQYQGVKSLLGLEVSPYELKLKELEKEKAALEVERLEAEMEASTIRAPFDGRVVSIYARERDAVEAYKTVLKVADPVELEVQVTLPYGTDSNKLVRGQKVLVNVTGETWVDGHIHQIAMSEEGTSSFDNKPVVQIRLEDPNIPLEFDSLVKVTILIEEADNALLVPKAAVRNYMGRKFVRVLDGDARREVDVVVGIEGDTHVQILKGLEEGQTVIGK